MKALLTPHQLKIMVLRANGWSIDEVAKEMYCSASSVTSALHKIYQKLGAHGGDHAVAICFARGLIQPEQINVPRLPGINEPVSIPSEGRHPVKDLRPENPRPVCPECAIWVCHECWQYRRRGATRAIGTTQNCARCGGIEGEYLAVRHHNPKTHKEL